MEEQYYADRTYLRHLMKLHSTWTIAQYMVATGRSRSWVKKWRKRLTQAHPQDDSVLRGQSRARHLWRLLTPSGPDSSLRQPIGSHDVSLPESACVGVETAVERPTVVDWMELESAR